MRKKILTKIFNKRQHQLYASALAITKNKESAEDAVHDALIAVAAIKKDPENLEAYLFRTVRNKALHLCRVNKKSEQLDENYLETEGQNEDMAILIQQIKKHIPSLNLNEQQALILKLFNDLTFNEMALILGESENTIASWYRRGLEKLKELLNEKL